ncbi:MAG: hypothetical protein WCH61_02855 [bacterium]
MKESPLVSGAHASLPAYWKHGRDQSLKSGGGKVSEGRYSCGKEKKRDYII